MVDLALFEPDIPQNTGAILGGGAAEARQSEFEIDWMVATLLAFRAIFAWAASQNFSLGEPSPDPLQIRVVAKRWMWKAQDPGGEREIDALYIPVGQPIRILLNSQDVIHSF